MPDRRNRVLTTPVKEYNKETLDILLECITGRTMNQFVQDVLKNKDGLYDQLISEKGEDLHANEKQS